MQSVFSHKPILGLIGAVFVLTSACADVDVTLNVAESFTLDSTDLTNGTTLEIDLSGKIPEGTGHLKVQKATLTQFDFSATCTGILLPDISMDSDLISIEASVADDAKPFFALAMPKGLSALKNDVKVGGLLRFMPCTNLFESNEQAFQLSRSQLETINKSLTNWKTFGTKVRSKPLMITLSKGEGVPEGDWRIAGTVKATLNLTLGLAQ